MKILLLASLFVMPSLATGATVLIGPGTNNGNFNEDTSVTDSRSFGNTAGWTNLGAAQTMQATRLNLNSDGSRNAVISEAANRIFGNATGHTIQSADIFSVSYQWRDAFNWNDASDQVQVLLFTTDDNTIFGNQNILATDLSGTSTQNNTYELVDHDVIYTATASAAGKQLFLQFRGLDGSGNANGFGRVDNFLLEVSQSNPIPEPAIGILGLFGLVLLLRRKR